MFAREYIYITVGGKRYRCHYNCGGKWGSSGKVCVRKNFLGIAYWGYLTGFRTKFSIRHQPYGFLDECKEAVAKYLKDQETREEFFSVYGVE